MTNLEDCDGWGILLTNDSKYWDTSPSTRADADTKFSVSEGRKLTGKMGWEGATNKEIERSRPDDLNVHGHYSLQWNDYSDLGIGKPGQFRYLAVQVK